MFCSENVDGAVDCIKVLVENNRCELCDKIDGERLIYPCGHSHCDDCVDKSSHCLLCLTPPNAGLQEPSLDNPATSRANNAEKLLKTFQETFQVDVYKRSRLSEQLRIEKEVFPECIQAPAKYYNKRKSSLANKENQSPSILPGEHISPNKLLKMENSSNYVHQWLESSEKVIARKRPHTPRRPFADLNANNYSSSPFKRGIPKRSDLILEKARESNENSAKKRKRSFKSALAAVDSKALLDQYWKPPEKGQLFQKIREHFEESNKEPCKLMNKTDRDESGIVIDDEPIVIDSCTQTVDKDKLAWLAVLEANEKAPYLSQTSKIESEVVHHTNDAETAKDQTNIHNKSYYKVPFLKKSYLSETCKHCMSFNSNSHKTDNTDIKTAGQSKDVTITIESKSFITTIKMSTVKEKAVFGKQSIPTQTDIVGTEKVILNEIDVDKINLENSKPLLEQTNFKKLPFESKHSKYMFTAKPKTAGVKENKLLHDRTAEGVAQVVISDSDSDDPLNASSTFEVTAEVHISNDQLEQGVLAELEESIVHQRAKRNARGHTPNSSDSSDKENFDPNRMKKMKFGKKGLKKSIK